jgi:hypothetical protein
MGLESARDKHVDWSGEKLNFEFGFLDHTNNFWMNLLLAAPWHKESWIGRCTPQQGLCKVGVSCPAGGLN